MIGRKIAAAALAAAIAVSSVAARAEPVTVAVDNLTRPTACAEEDNVSLAMRATHHRPVTRFRVEALPPAYLADIRNDVTAPDFAACNFDGGVHPSDPAYRFTERHVVLHDGPRWRIEGIVLPSFWRPHQVPVTIGRRTETGLHLLQVFAKQPSGTKPLEVLVMYPADGYWRIKPVPEPRFGDGVYGSSFVLGPVTRDTRPVVDIESISVSVEPLVLHLRFADGGRADVGIVEAGRSRMALDVRLHDAGPPAGPDGRPFAVLRSMYVAPDNADVSEIAWRSAPGGPMTTRPLPAVDSLIATDLRFGRSVPSRHNTSAPDIRFFGFESAD